MILQELFEADAPTPAQEKSRTQVYLDMDGVLCDFFEEYARLAGNPKDGSGRYNYRNIPPAKTDPTLNKMVGTDFFYRLPKFPTTDALVSLVVKIFGSYNICSSPLRGDHENSAVQKRRWLQDNLAVQPQEVIITPQKQKYAVQSDGTPNILIDDRGSNITAWEAAGGVGIKYQADEDGLDTVVKGLKRAMAIIRKEREHDRQELVSRDRSLPVATDRDQVSEAPLADYQPLGDFSKPGPFRGPDKKLVPHPTNQLKTARFFEQTPYDFRLFFSNISGTGRYSEYGAMDPETVKIIFGDSDAGEQIVRGHEDAITIVFVGNKGDSKVMLTPWMMAHRIGHAIQATGRMRQSEGPWKAAEDHFFRTINALLDEFYGRRGNPGGQLKNELRGEYNALFNAIGTQRSSRQGEITRPYEFLYELFAQYLGTGRITLNPLPKQQGYGRKAWGRSTRSLNLRGDAEETKYTTEVLARDMELMFDDVLSSMVGKILVM